MRENTMMRKLVLVALLTAAPTATQAQQYHRQTEARTAPTGSIVIRNLDELWTGTGEVLRNVSIAIRDGRIVGVGATVPNVPNATVIEGRGFTAMPGIVDEHSHIAMGSGSNEGTAPVVPEVRVIDSLEPGDFGIYRALSGGVTTAQILHGSSNPIGGQAAIIKTRWGMDDANRLLIGDVVGEYEGLAEAPDGLHQGPWGGIAPFGVLRHPFRPAGAARGVGTRPRRPPAGSPSPARS